MFRRIAVDVGYGYTKALSDRGERDLFPSVIAPEEEDSALDDALGAKRSPQRVTIQRLGNSQQSWLFGRAALIAPGATRPWAEDASSREGYDVLVMAAIASLIRVPAVEAVDVDLVLGLPLGVYGAQREKLRAALKGQEAYISINDRVQIRVRISSVLVLPQAVGAYYSSVLNADGSMRADLVKRPTGVIDVGTRTTDYFVMQRDDNGLRPVKALSGSLDTGVSGVYEALRRRAQAMTGHMIDSLRVEAALREQDGVLLDMGREIDLKPWLREESRNVAGQVANELRVAWGKHLAGLGAVLLAGGGALLLGDDLRALHPALKVVDDPVFANTAGFLAARAMAA